ncbi:hypothetical protein B0H17DRAFT_1139068 [Mycena rosella]|uniref:Secreted protein n=1 Tax=Mycena rosella TaxID=1033263 RepID=A0AAD7D8H0_MYCRO|nr:hypothetical protein B0H17DRAFT_1139068 [Mycena rosella]
MLCLLAFLPILSVIPSFLDCDTPCEALSGLLSDSMYPRTKPELNYYWHCTSYAYKRYFTRAAAVFTKPSSLHTPPRLEKLGGQDLMPLKKIRATRAVQSPAEFRNGRSLPETRPQQCQTRATHVGRLPQSRGTSQGNPACVRSDDKMMRIFNETRLRPQAQGPESSSAE